MTRALARDAIAADIVGVEAGPIGHALDARWLMAYAAALGEADPRSYDTLAAQGPLAHPLFAVCYEWPVALALRDLTIAADLQPRGVHATHHLVIHRPPRAGDRLRTTARVIAVELRRAGTLIVSRFETVDAAGNRVTTTDYGSVYRGVGLTGIPPTMSDAASLSTGDGAPGAPARPAAAGSPGAPAPPSPAGAGDRWTDVVDIPATAALVYTECARIWNPIHTDVAVARGAGLSAPILHGTATLARALSRVVARDLGGEPARVAEVRGRFTGMVPMPSSITVRGRPGDGRAVAFDVVSATGGPILSQGVVVACDR
jgi:acyl dehydratase